MAGCPQSSMPAIPEEFSFISTQSFCPWARVHVSLEAARIISPLSSGPSAPEAREIFQNRLLTSGHAITRHRLVSGTLYPIGYFRALPQLSRIYKNIGVPLLGLFLVWALVSILELSRDPPTAERFKALFLFFSSFWLQGFYIFRVGIFPFPAYNLY